MYVSVFRKMFQASVSFSVSVLSVNPEFIQWQVGLWRWPYWNIWR